MALSQAPPPGSHAGAATYSMGLPASSSSLPVTVPPLLASIWGPLPIGRPSAEWQQSSKGQPEQAAPPKSEQLPRSPEHRQCSAY